MKAVAWTKYGKPADALQIINIEKPKPNKFEVLIKVHSSTVTAGDVRLRAFKVPTGFWLPTRIAFGFFKPRKNIIGMDFSGVVEAIGKNVTLFNIGDVVYGTSGMHLSANAEYICLTEKSVFIKKPENISHKYAVASLFGGQTAIHFLKEKDLSTDLKTQIREMLEVADLVKFAKAKPPVNINEKLMKDAISFVKTTKYVPRIEEGFEELRN